MRIHKIQLLIIFIITLIIGGCSTDRIALSTNTILPENISVFLGRDSLIDQESFDLFKNAATEFITTFNKQNHSFKLHKTLYCESALISITITKNNLVTRQKAIKGLIISTLGFSLLGASIIYVGIPVGFFYLPVNHTRFRLHLSEELSSDEDDLELTITSRHQFQNYQAQICKQAEKFKKLLSEIFNNLDQEYQKMNK